MISGWYTSYDRFQQGDQVWPLEGPMVLQHGPSTVMAVISHDQYGEWLWLVDDDGGPRSYAARWWTTIRPSDEELANRKSRCEQRFKENEAMWAEVSIPHRMNYRFT